MRVLGDVDRTIIPVEFAGLSVSTSRRFFSFFDTGEGGGIATALRYAGGMKFRIVEVGVVALGSPGDTIIGLHRSGSSSPEVTSTIDPGGADTWQRHAFSLVIGLDEDVSVSFDPVSTPGDVRGYMHILPLP